MREGAFQHWSIISKNIKAMFHLPAREGHERRHWPQISSPSSQSQHQTKQNIRIKIEQLVKIKKLQSGRINHYLKTMFYSKTS